MDRHRYGSRHGIALDSFSEILIRRSNRHMATTLTSVNARVVSDELYLRVQYWISLDADDVTTLVNHDIREICRHFGDAVHDTDIRQLVECKTLHMDCKDDCPTCSPVLRCEFCAVEVQLDVKRFGKYNALVWTKWLNLGHGESPSDPTWQGHDSCPPQRRGEWQSSKVLSQPSLRTAFESVAGRTLAELTEENQRILHQQCCRQFRKLLWEPDSTTFDWRGFRGDWTAENWVRYWTS